MRESESLPVRRFPLFSKSFLTAVVRPFVPVGGGEKERRPITCLSAGRETRGEGDRGADNKGEFLGDTR